MFNLAKSVVKKTPLSPIAHKIYYKLGFSSQNEIYNQQTIEVMKRCLREDSICIDIGANKGEVLQDITNIATNKNHFVFEPIPDLANLLQDKYSDLNIYQIALSDRQGEVEFQHFVNMDGYSGLGDRKVSVSSSGAKPEIKKFLVRTNTLDNIIPTDTKVSFIKIDIEGAEYLAMRGGIKTIVKNKPIIIFEAEKETMDLFGITPEKIYNLLSGECQLKISSMKRWLDNKSEYSKQDFCNFIDFRMGSYFIAYP